MKIAYLFHGHSRTWKDCFQSFFDNVYSIAPGDIYIHTWDRINSKYGSFWNGNLDLHPHQLEGISSQATDLESIKAAYNPKHIIIETDPGIELGMSRLPQISSIRSSPAHIGVYNMFYSQQQAFKMSEMYGSYDKYFSCRMDLFFINKLNTLELYENNHLMVSPTFIDNVIPNDFYAFGDKHMMKIKSDFVETIWEYWYAKNNLWYYGPEHAVGQYYNDNNIQLKGSELHFELRRLF